MMIYKKPPKTHIVLVSPEIGNLNGSDLGDLADMLSGKGGGLGDVTAAMFTGLRQAGADISLLAPNFKKIYRTNAKLTEDEWRKKRHTTDPQGINLVGSKVFEHVNKIYGNKDAQGNDLDILICSRFQENSRHALKDIEAKNAGRIIVDFQDFVGSGVLAAYLKSRKIANVQTIHNTHTKIIPLDYYQDIDLDSFEYELFLTQFTEYRKGIDSLATGIKNADYVKFVGTEFARRLYTGELDFDKTITNNVIQEIKQKYANEKITSIPNSISPRNYPENQNIPRVFSEITGDILDAKKTNKIELQKKVGLKQDKNALLYVSTSRLDPNQKGVQHFPNVIAHLANKYEDVQFFIIGDETKSEEGIKAKQDIIHTALASNGKISYAAFNEELCALAYASATDSFGASYKEPFGQNDVIGMINGSTATNTNVDGYKDKINPISMEQIQIIKEDLKNFSEPIQKEKALDYIQELKQKKLFGNGFLFEKSTTKDLKQGLENSISINRYFRDNPNIGNAHARLRMIDAKHEYKLEKMINNLIDLYMTIEKDKIDKQEWTQY